MMQKPGTGELEITLATLVSRGPSHATAAPAVHNSAAHGSGGTRSDLLLASPRAGWPPVPCSLGGMRAGLHVLGCGSPSPEAGGDLLWRIGCRGQRLRRSHVRLR